MTFKVSDNQYGQLYHSNSWAKWASCFFQISQHLLFFCTFLVFSGVLSDSYFACVM